MPRILVIDGNEAATRAKHVSVGGTDSGDGYAATLKRLQPDSRCDIVRPADEEPKLPDGVALGDYDGAVITGSALNIYSREAAVERQIDLAKAVFAAGVPCFGSCWGLQVGVTAAGGSVVRNPRGREFGFARRISSRRRAAITRCSRASPKCSRPCTVHVDTVDSLPAGATPLAHNDMGLQAAEIRFKNGATSGACNTTPSTACAEAAAMARRYAEVLIRDGLVQGPGRPRCAGGRSASRSTHNPDDPRLAWRFGVGEADHRSGIKLAEIRNWLERHVLAIVRAIASLLWLAPRCCSRAASPACWRAGRRAA